MAQVSVAALAAQGLIPDGDQLIVTNESVMRHNAKVSLLSGSEPGRPTYKQSFDQEVAFVPLNQMTKLDASQLMGVPVSVSLLDGDIPPAAPPTLRAIASVEGDGLPESFDVTEAFKDMVVDWKVQNQQNCGSCWAVSAADALSFQVALVKSKANGKKPVSVDDLSASQLLGCNIGENSMGINAFPRSTELQTTSNQSNSFEQWQKLQNEKANNTLPNVVDTWGPSIKALAQMEFTDGRTRLGNSACLGGIPEYAQAFIALNNGLGSTSLTTGPYAYPTKPLLGGDKAGLPPFLASANRERFCIASDVVMTPLRNCDSGETGPECFTITDPVELKKFIMEHGPVQTTIKVPRSFMAYSEGVYDSTLHDKGENEVIGGHAVVIVGWGKEGRTPYWRLKNSWGDRWGEKGYIRVVYNERILFSGNEHGTAYGYATNVMSIAKDPTSAAQQSWSTNMSTDQSQRQSHTNGRSPASVPSVAAGTSIPCVEGSNISRYGVQMSSCAAGDVWQSSAVPATAGRFCAAPTDDGCSRYSMSVPSAVVQTVGLVPFAARNDVPTATNDCTPAVMAMFPAVAGGLRGVQPAEYVAYVPPQATALLAPVPQFTVAQSAVMNVNSPFNALPFAQITLTPGPTCHSRASALNLRAMHTSLPVSMKNFTTYPCSQGSGAWFGAALQSIK